MAGKGRIHAGREFLWNGSGILHIPKQDLGRDPQTRDQGPDHFEAEAAAARENLGDTAWAAQEGRQILVGEALLGHSETNRGYWVRPGDWEDPFLVIVD